MQARSWRSNAGRCLTPTQNAVWSSRVKTASILTKIITIITKRINTTPQNRLFTTCWHVWREFSPEKAAAAPWKSWKIQKIKLRPPFRGPLGGPPRVKMKLLGRFLGLGGSFFIFDKSNHKNYQNNQHNALVRFGLPLSHPWYVFCQSRPRLQYLDERCTWTWFDFSKLHDAVRVVSVGVC